MPTWEIRRSAFDDRLIWGLFDHTLDAYGNSHQFLQGARKIRSRKLYEQLLLELVKDVPVAAVLLRQSYQVPTGYESRTQDLLGVEIDGNVLSLETVRDRGGKKIIEAFLGRNGSDPDDVPDCLWFPCDKIENDLLAVLATVTDALRSEIPEGLRSVVVRSMKLDEIWARFISESSLALMVDGHLYFLCCTQMNGRIEKTILQLAASSNLLTPQPWPSLSVDDPMRFLCP